MKRRYYNLMAIAALAVILFCLLSGFSPQDPDETAELLASQRSKILKSTHEKKISVKEAEKRLRRIEGEGLLAKDLEKLQRGQWESSYGMPKFKEIRQKKKVFPYITYQAEILWDRGDAVTSSVCNVVLKEENEKYILTILETAKP